MVGTHTFFLLAQLAEDNLALLPFELEILPVPSTSIVWVVTPPPTVNETVKEEVLEPTLN